MERERPASASICPKRLRTSVASTATVPFTSMIASARQGSGHRTASSVLEPRRAGALMAWGLLMRAPDESPFGERKRKHGVALRDRDYRRPRTRDDHRGLSRDRCI